MEWTIFKSNHKNPESEIAYNKLSARNKDKLGSWMVEKAVTCKSVKRTGNRRRAIIKFLGLIKKDYDKYSYQDYVDVATALSNSKCGIKARNSDRYFVKSFMKDTSTNWEEKNKKDWNKTFKDLKLLKAEQEGEANKITHDDLISELELDKLIKATSDLKKKTLIIVLYESAARPEELLKLRWHDIEFDSKLIHLFSGKTKKKRVVPIDTSIEQLKRLKDEVEASNDDDLVFPSASGEIMTNSGLNYMLQELGRKAGIQRKLHCYIFRHTRLSTLITKLSGKVYEEVAGHSLSMGMKTYAHLSQDAIIKEMREKVFNVKELNEGEISRLIELEGKMEKLLTTKLVLVRDGKLIKLKGNEIIRFATPRN